MKDFVSCLFQSAIIWAMSDRISFSSPPAAWPAERAAAKLAQRRKTAERAVSSRVSCP